MDDLYCGIKQKNKKNTYTSLKRCGGGVRKQDVFMRGGGGGAGEVGGGA